MLDRLLLYGSCRSLRGSCLALLSAHTSSQAAELAWVQLQPMLLATAAGAAPAAGVCRPQVHLPEPAEQQELGMLQESVEQQTPRRRQRDPNFMGYTYKGFHALPSSNGAPLRAASCWQLHACLASSGARYVRPCAPARWLKQGAVLQACRHLHMRQLLLVQARQRWSSKRRPAHDRAFQICRQSPFTGRATCLALAAAGHMLLLHAAAWGAYAAAWGHMQQGLQPVLCTALWPSLHASQSGPERQLLRRRACSAWTWGPHNNSPASCPSS